MRRHDLLDLAVANNVHWYTSMCAAHGISFVSRQQYWLSKEAMPPYHSNFVTASGPDDRHLQREALQSLRDELGDGDWSVKDSYNALGLDRRGYSLHLRAQWLCLDGPVVCPSYCTDEFYWTAISTQDELHEWVSFWSAQSESAAHVQPPFPPAVLQNPELTFLIGRFEGENAAVAAANRSGHAVGVSNVVARPDVQSVHWYSCIRTIQRVFPGLVVVGYGDGNEAAAMRDVGFRTLGGLSVWTAQPD